MQQVQVILLSLLCGCSLCAAELTVQARFTPPKIALGDRAQYIIEVTETDTARMPQPETVRSLPLPTLSGLNLINGRTASRSQTNFVNGKGQFSHTQSFSLDAKVTRTGQFTIPEFGFSYKGQTVQVPSATLTVVERGADAAPSLDELLFLDVELPPSLYVGQSAPIELKLYSAEEVHLSGINAFERQADAYIISELPKEASEKTEMLKGRRYRVLTWPLSITPIQTGQQALDFNFTVSARTQQRNDPFAPRNPFGGRLFEDFFGSNERFKIASASRSIEVQALPTLDQPESFSGAIGDFTLQVYTDLDSTKVGEPIMLSMEIIGSGNFDRIQGPAMPERSEWRSYPPESSFQAKDTLSLEGTKRFDYVFIPRTSGELLLPEVAFSFLDPQSGNYVELKSPPLKVEVRANPSLPSQSTPLPIITSQAESASENGIELTRALTPEEALLTLDYRQQPAAARSATLLQSATYYLANAALLVIGVALAYYLQRRRRLANDAVYALRHAAKDEFKQAYAAALHTTDSAVFYPKAQLALRLAATRQTGTNLRAANAKQINARIQNPEIAPAIVELFATADALRFGQAAIAPELTTARQQLKTLLKKL
jgi:hypothetical protein